MTTKPKDTSVAIRYLYEAVATNFLEVVPINININRMIGIMLKTGATNIGDDTDTDTNTDYVQHSSEFIDDSITAAHVTVPQTLFDMNITATA